jgi:hypothetical protein
MVDRVAPDPASVLIWLSVLQFLFTAQPQAPASFKSRRLWLGGKRLSQRPACVRV